jgi:CBS domain-containing protein
VTARVADVLDGAAVVVAPCASLAETRAIMTARHVDHAAVVADGRLVGLVTAADLDAARPSPATLLAVQEIRAALDAIPVASVVRDLPAVSLRTPLAEAARLMRDYDLSALGVLRGEGVVGVLTDLDVLAWMCGETGP